MINRARIQARKAMEKLYEHTCTITEYKKVKNTTTKITEMKEVVVLEKQPCKLSFSSGKKSEQTSSGDKVGQMIKVFLAPEVVVKEGSKFTIQHNGRVGEYCNAGTPSIFKTHQEIILESFKGWA